MSAEIDRRIKILSNKLHTNPMYIKVFVYGESNDEQTQERRLKWMEDEYEKKMGEINN